MKMNEKYLYTETYMFIKGYATALKLGNTLKALPMCVIIHDGQYRKGKMEFENEQYQIPYVVHCLKVCSTLIALDLPLERHDLDILLAAALLHDTLEDQPQKFPHAGEEFMSQYGLDPEVLHLVKLVTKRTGASQEELRTYFNVISGNPLATLLKLSDRSHNSESMYEMTPEKIRKYIKESREGIYPMASYGKNHYPEFSNGITILKSKIESLVNTTEALLEMFGNKEA